MMTILTNGSSRQVPAPMSVRQLVEHLNLVPDLTLVELNGEVVLRNEWSDKLICEGDRLEFVRVAAGG